MRLTSLAVVMVAAEGAQTVPRQRIGGGHRGEGGTELAEAVPLGRRAQPIGVA